MQAIAIATLTFTVENKYFKWSTYTEILYKNNILFKIIQDNGVQIYAVSKGKEMRILTPEGVEFVQLEYVKHKL